MVRKEASDAMSNNEPFDVASLRAKDTSTFLAQCANAIREGRHHDNNGEIEKQIDWLFKINSHLPITHTIRRLSEGDELLFKP
jgi:hypothetical protein